MIIRTARREVVDVGPYEDWFRQYDRLVEMGAAQAAEAAQAARPRYELQRRAALAANREQAARRKAQVREAVRRHRARM